MADELESLGEDLGGSESGKKRPNYLAIAMMLIIIVVIAWTQGLIGGKGDKSIGDGKEGTTLDIKKAQEREQKERQHQQELGGLDIGNVGEKKNLETMAIQIQDVKKIVKDQEDQLTKLKRENENFKKELKNQLDKSFVDIKDQLEKLSRERVENDFRAGLPGETTPQYPGTQPFSGQQADEVKKFDYRIMNNNFGQQDGKNKKRLQGTTNTQSDDLLNFDPAKSQTNATNNQSVQVAQNGNTTSLPATTIKTGLDEKYQQHPIDIAASSRVKALVSETIACPIGKGVLDDTRLNPKGAVPVTLIVNGIFEGPQGHTVDIGNVHLQGFCVGIRGQDRGRIKVTSLSYVGDDGKSIYVDNVNGYLQDLRDMQADVKGVYFGQRATQITYAALADAFRSVGDLTTAAEFDTVTSPDGNVQSSFSGQIGRATGGAIVSGAANRFAQMIADDAETYVDTIIIPAGAPVYFKTLKPIQFTGVRYKEIEDDYKL